MTVGVYQPHRRLNRSFVCWQGSCRGHCPASLLRRARLTSQRRSTIAKLQVILGEGFGNSRNFRVTAPCQPCRAQSYYSERMLYRRGHQVTAAACNDISTSEGKLVFKTDSSSFSIHYRGDRPLEVEEFGYLVEKVGWPKRSRLVLETAIQNSYYIGVLLAHSEQIPDRGEVVGLARVVSDGAFNASIWDVLIDPEYQGLGLGKGLVSEVVRHLVGQGITNITTFAEKGNVQFYSKLGFQADPDGVRGMFWLP